MRPLPACSVRLPVHPLPACCPCALLPPCALRVPYPVPPSPAPLQVKSCVDYGFLEDFCRRVIAEEYQPLEKKAVLINYVQVFKTRLLPQDQLERILQTLIIPTLLKSLEAGQVGG